jgi:hypothetical protein
MAKKIVKLTETDLHKIIKESVKEILKETRLDYDEDNFSGKYSLTNDDDYIDLDGSLDDPYNEPNSFDDEDWIDGDKDMENDYSWNLFNQKPIAPGVGGYYKVNKLGVKKDIDDAHMMRNRQKNWTEKELQRAEKQKQRYLSGKNIDDFTQEYNK